MKNKFLVLGLLFFSQILFAQKFGYIDSEAILKKMKEYDQAQKDIDKITEKWTLEVSDKQKEVQKLKEDFAIAELLLTDDIKKERLDTIAKKEKASKELQNKYFGYEGMLFQKRQEVMKPVREKLFAAVQKVCKSKQIQIMFDKAADVVMIYSDPKHDYTDFVLEALGLGDKQDSIDNKRDKDN
ncbi:MAG: OmpH family outer membrane protein [Cytophagales bacterium]